MSEELLSASGEAAWQSLRQHIEWTEGFWVGWVFTDHTPSVHELHQRIEGQLRAVGRGAVIEQPREPGELVAVLGGLLAGADGCDGCVTVAVVRQDEAWQAAWDQFLLRLNERRELLRQVLRGGLLLCAPTKFKARSREAAPDLWSIRSLALEVAPVPSMGRELSMRPREDVRDDGPGSSDSVTLALQAVAAAQRAVQPDAETVAHLRAAEALFAVGRREEAREQASYAVQVAPTAVFRAHALVVLAGLEHKLEDLVAAERHYRAAIEADARASGAPAYGYLSQLLLMRGALDEAESAAERGLWLCRERRERCGDTVDTLQDVSASLQRVGDVREAQGNWSGAASTHTEVLTLSRRIRELVGDTAEALIDEAISLARVGDILQAQGDLSGAGAAFEDSLALRRRVSEMMDGSAEALQKEVWSLLRAGDVRRVQGDWSGAASAYDDGLALSRRIRAMVGDTADALRDMAVCLGRVGDRLRAQGDSTGAMAAYEGGLALSRRVREIVGDTAEALREVSLSRKRVGDAQRARGDWNGAGMAYHEGLALIRRVRSIVGDLSPVVNDLARSLQQCASVYRHQGQIAAAREMLQEAVDLLSGVQARGPASPRIATAFAEASEALADLLRDPAAEP